MKYDTIYTFNDLAYDLACNICQYLNDGDYEDLNDAIMSELDNFLIWTDNQWDLLKYYCDPSDCDLSSAIDEFINDLYSCIQEIEEDEEDEE